MRNAFIAALIEAAAADPRVMLLTADTGAIVLDEFRARLPRQFLNVGVSEAVLVGAAAGLALAGRRPFLYAIAPFLVWRAAEQIRNDVAMQRLPVIVVGLGGGVAYSTLGPTHHASEDVAVMRALPQMTVVAPGDAATTAAAVRQLAGWPGPAYLRLGTTSGPALPAAAAPFRVGQARVLREGTAGTIVACGEMIGNALAAAELLAAAGHAVRVVEMATVKPLAAAALEQALAISPLLVTCEEHSVIGGLGSAVAEWVAEQPVPGLAFRRLGLPDRYYFFGGTRRQLWATAGLLPEQIAASVMACLSPRAAATAASPPPPASSGPVR